MKIQKFPELLAPAGSLEKLKAAIAHGADTIYCGLPSTSLRARENEFTLAKLKTARKLTREASVRMYVTFNIYPRDRDLKNLEKELKAMREVEPDALILADAGLLSLAKKILPKMKLHLSVQANTLNSVAVKFWYENGVRRVIVARELSITEIAAIKKAVPKMELEMFVHGAICMSYSGRCLLSLYLTGRDANRGVCAQPCRWKYFLTEEKRPDEPLILEEDSHGSYILNSKDLCLLSHLEQISAAGISALKIEGRHKTVGYLATVVHAYRRALDNLRAGKNFDKKLLEEIASTGNRGFTLGFFDGSQKDLQNFERSGSENPQTFVGIVEKSKTDRVEFSPRNRIEVGEKIVAMIPRGDSVEFACEKIWDSDGEEISTAHGGGEKIAIATPQNFPKFTILRKTKK